MKTKTALRFPSISSGCEEQGQTSPIQGQTYLDNLLCLEFEPQRQTTNSANAPTETASLQAASEAPSCASPPKAFGERKKDSENQPGFNVSLHHSQAWMTIKDNVFDFLRLQTPSVWPQTWPTCIFCYKSADLDWNEQKVPNPFGASKNAKPTFLTLEMETTSAKKFQLQNQKPELQNPILKIQNRTPPERSATKRPEIQKSNTQNPRQKFGLALGWWVWIFHNSKAQTPNELSQ